MITSKLCDQGEHGACHALVSVVGNAYYHGYYHGKTFVTTDCGCSCHSPQDHIFSSGSSPAQTVDPKEFKELNHSLYAHMIREFHDLLKLTNNPYPDPDSPEDATAEWIEFRKNLLTEEVGELLSAIDSGDMSDITKESIDVVFVTLGMLIALGIDIDLAFALVARSNLTKVDIETPIAFDEKGKPVKDHVNYYVPPAMDIVACKKRLGSKEKNNA
jgi:predicted HAD superfamily Cof-like phosphohydrolase